MALIFFWIYYRYLLLIYSYYYLPLRHSLLRNLPSSKVSIPAHLTSIRCYLYINSAFIYLLLSHSFLNNYYFTLLVTYISHINCLYMQSIIIYSILSALGTFLVYLLSKV